MKKLIYISLVFLAFTACASGGRISQADRPASPNLISQQEAGEEYELIIMDPGFRTWFATYGRPVNFHSQSYYEQWNNRYVIQWNQLASSGGISRYGDNPFQNRIDYEPNIDYGLQLNHELYWYFRYVESQYGARYNFGSGRNNL